jgi:natural product precursor
MLNKMKKINLKSAQLKEMLSKDEMKKVVGGGTYYTVDKWLCGDNGTQYYTPEACDVNCVQACYKITVTECYQGRGGTPC